MAPPSLPRPSDDRGPGRLPWHQAPLLLSAAPPEHRAADTEAPPCRIPDGGQSLCRLPAPAGIPGPGGERPGRLPGPDGPDRLASGAPLPATAACDPQAPAHRGTAAFDLPAVPAAVGTARHVVRDLLTAWGVPEDARDDVVLVVSELVTNALVHAAGEWIGCRLLAAADRVRIEVEDQAGGPALPAVRRPGPDDPHGRGLLLVGTLSHDWGVTAVPGRRARVVWADLPSGRA
ncbi:ATP-binding protein [Streptomyces sp. NPDC014991]|uniref:ATP-binding protein n=1 Tax=Streptomyces sp. NPDC014991 TaxID=3364935 RepID=UPI0036FFA213